MQESIQRPPTYRNHILHRKVCGLELQKLATTYASFQVDRSTWYDFRKAFDRFLLEILSQSKKKLNIVTRNDRHRHKRRSTNSEVHVIPLLEDKIICSFYY